MAHPVILGIRFLSCHSQNYLGRKFQRTTGGAETQQLFFVYLSESSSVLIFEERSRDVKFTEKGGKKVLKTFSSLGVVLYFTSIT